MLAASAPAPKRSVAVLKSPPASPGFGPSAACSVDVRVNTRLPSVSDVRPDSGSAIGGRPEPVIEMPMVSPTCRADQACERPRHQDAGARERDRRAVGRVEGLDLRVGGEALELGRVAARAALDDDVGGRRGFGHGYAADRAQLGELVGADGTLVAHLRVDALEARGAVEGGAGRVHYAHRGEDRDEGQRARERHGGHTAGADRVDAFARHREHGDGVGEERGEQRRADGDCSRAERRPLDRVVEREVARDRAHEDSRSEPAREQAPQETDRDRPGDRTQPGPPAQTVAVIVRAAEHTRRLPGNERDDERADEQEDAGEDDRGVVEAGPLLRQDRVGRLVLRRVRERRAGAAGGARERGVDRAVLALLR